jgi:hypothetical protein
MRDKFEMEGMWQNQNVDVSSQMAAADVGLDLGDVIDAMRSLNLTRMGGAPGFWNAWRPEKSEEDEDASGTPPPVDKGKGKATDGEIDGWDWAGVEGEWRRVVCWLDYRDLLSSPCPYSNVHLYSPISGSAQCGKSTHRIRNGGPARDDPHLPHDVAYLALLASAAAPTRRGFN